MSGPENNPEWLERPEPVRVDPADFKFRQTISQRELREIESQTHGGECLAKQIASGEGISRGSISYAQERINEDGTAEQLVGCGACGAMCTVTYSSRLHKAVMEDLPHDVLSIAEAPQPNPWRELGTFDDCKAGDVRVPKDASALVQPVGLDYEQRQLVRIFSGVAD